MGMVVKQKLKLTHKTVEEAKRTPNNVQNAIKTAFALDRYMPLRALHLETTFAIIS